MKIKELAETMYVPGLEHVRRLEMLGKKLSGKTLNQKKQLLGKIVQTFGDCDIEDLSIRSHAVPSGLRRGKKLILEKPLSSGLQKPLQ